MWSTSFFPRKLVTERRLPSSRDGRTKCGKGSPTRGSYSSELAGSTGPAIVATSRSRAGTKTFGRAMARPIFYCLLTIGASATDGAIRSVEPRSGRSERHGVRERKPQSVAQNYNSWCPRCLGFFSSPDRRRSRATTPMKIPPIRSGVKAM